MQVNRYTQFQPARYNPRTLQELMIAPMYKREQHDNLLNTSAELESAIAQVDPLDMHSETAAAEQKRLYDEITKQVDMLNTEGFNPSAKSNFIKLNKQYQQAIAPTGMLGKVNTAKAKLNENREKYMQGAIEAGYSPTQAQQRWEEFQSTYAQQFEKTGAVENIGELYAPKYFDYIEEGRKVFKDAGITSTDISTGGGKIESDEQGTYVVNTQNRDVNSSNIKQLQAAVDFLNNRIQNPNSDAYKSILHQGKTPQDALNELAGLADVFIKDETGSQRTSSIGSYRPPIKDNQIGIPNFFDDVVQGYGKGSLDKDSPLNDLESFEDAVYDENGNIVAPEGGYKTYKDKVKAFKEKGYDVNETTGVATSPFPTTNMAGVTEMSFAVSKDPHHNKPKLDEIRRNNPSLKDLNDQELVGRMRDYREVLNSNYINVMRVAGANYEPLNDLVFGNQQGKGERSTGIFDSKGGTISGREYTATEVIDQLGYDNIKEFKELGQPTFVGYSAILGKWEAVAANKDGEGVKIYIDDIPKISRKATITKLMGKAMIEGSSFKSLGKTSASKELYFINDFMNPPRVVEWTSGVSNAAMIPQHVIDESATSYDEVYGEEKMSLLVDPLFQQLANIKPE